MREIKFRVWSGTGREMKYDELYLTIDGKLEYDGRDCSRMPLMQFTGLKDKNGTDIFEGDIVTFCVAWGEPDEEDMKDPDKWLTREIKFKNGSFAPEIHGDAGIAGLEVIGNVHESPELLDKPA